MPKTTKTTKTAEPMKSLAELKTKMVEIKLTIKAGQEKNTNAHKMIKKEIAQFLTSAKGGSAFSGKTKQ